MITPALLLLRVSMVTGVLKVQLQLNGIGSLKAKRGIVKSVIGRLRSRFNVSASEVDHQDNKRCAVIGISMVSNDSAYIDQNLDKIVDFLQRDGRFFLGRTERENFW